MKKLAFFFLLIFCAACVRIPIIETLIGSTTSKQLPEAAFYDDFSDDDSGWDQIQSSAGSTGYHADMFRISVTAPNTDLFSNPGLSFKDIVVEVNARREEGPDDNSFGVICRYRDPQNFYSGQISSDGYAGIFRMKEGKYQLLGMDKMVPAPAVLGGATLNAIRLECIGHALILSVNGSPVDYREDDSFESGDVGLIAGTFGVPGVTISFDDFIVNAP